MSTKSQISATISAATKERPDRFTERHGLKKSFAVEEALLYFMVSRCELPDEAFIPRASSSTTGSSIGSPRSSMLHLPRPARFAS